MYFLFQKGPGPGTGHQLHGHGNSVGAAHSPHPTERKFHLRLLSGSIGYGKKSHNRDTTRSFSNSQKNQLTSYTYTKDSFNLMKHYAINQSHKTSVNRSTVHVFHFHGKKSEWKGELF